MIGKTFTFMLREKKDKFEKMIFEIISDHFTLSLLFPILSNFAFFQW